MKAVTTTASRTFEWMEEQGSICVKRLGRMLKSEYTACVFTRITEPSERM